MKLPTNETLFIMNHGHCAPEPLRSAFITQLLAFADLDSYPRRADFMKAFSPEGTRADRQREAAALTDAAYLDMDDYRYALKQAQSKFPHPSPVSEFVSIFLTYGGGRHFGVNEQQRLAFCNYLLVECLEECSYSHEFIQHFSTGGDTYERQRIASLIETHGYISMGDIVDAVFYSSTDTDRLVNYAGEDGVR